MELLQWLINFWVRKLLVEQLRVISNKELANELHKPIIRKFEKRKVRSPFIDNIWGADLAVMQLISKFNKGFAFLLCVVDIYSKYAWVVLLKEKQGITITNAFKRILVESNRKPNKIWVSKGSKFYNWNYNFKTKTLFVE